MNCTATIFLQNNFFQKNWILKKDRIFAPAKREKLRVFNILQADFSYQGSEYVR